MPEKNLQLRASKLQRVQYIYLLSLPLIFIRNNHLSEHDELAMEITSDRRLIIRPK